MEQSDSVKLLRECDAGVKMGIASINDVIDSVANPDMRQILTRGKKEHEKFETELGKLLEHWDAREKDPNAVAQVMSFVKTNTKLILNESDKTIADLMTDGCNMGVKSLYRYLNQYTKADNKIKDLARRIIYSEECILNGIKPFL